MPRELVTFPICSAVKHKLINAGYSDDSSFKGVTPLTLSKDSGISLQDALQVIKAINGSSAQTIDIKQCSAQALAQHENASSGIVTFSQKIDSIFGDGIPVGKITEFCGPPGIGKTQLSMQLCVDTVIPECFGGVQGQAIYIDTEGSFVAERIAQMAKATIQHCHYVANATNDPEMRECLKTFDSQHILKSIHYFKCNSCVELIALSHQLSDFIKSHCSNVKMIVVDSFAFHFRHGWSDMSNRTRTMNGLGQEFIKLASSLHTAVVLINQMTTRISSGSDGKMVPALGESWGHIATNRVLLFCQGGRRFANLFKSPNRKEDTVPYCITVDGIRDVDDDEPGGVNEAGPSRKRPRNEDSLV